MLLIRRENANKLSRVFSTCQNPQSCWNECQNWEGKFVVNMQFFAVIKLYLLQIFDDGYLHVVQLMQYVLLRTLHHHHFGTHTRIY